MTRTRIQSDVADLRRQLVAMLILVVVIVLRFIFVGGGGESLRGHPDIPSAKETQHDAARQ